MQSTEDWAWQKQLRYYMKGGGAIIRMSNARFSYTYEYQGNAPKLVHTPLTDKCYLTLTQVSRVARGDISGLGKAMGVNAMGMVGLRMRAGIGGR